MVVIEAVNAPESAARINLYVLKIQEYIIVSGSVCVCALGKAADLWWLVMFFCFCAEELQKQLVEQVELRKKLEREFQHLKGGSITSVFLWVKVTQTERERHAFYISVWIFKNRPCFTAKLFAGEGVFILFFSFESWIVSLNVSPQSQSFHLMWPSVLFR